MNKENTTKEKAKDIKENLDKAVKSADKAKEAIEILKVQLKEHLQQAEHHKTMATKAQGALEVLLQLHPEEDNSEG
jgi:hypothetical protein